MDGRSPHLSRRRSFVVALFLASVALVPPAASGSTIDPPPISLPAGQRGHRARARSRNRRPVHAQLAERPAVRDVDPLAAAIAASSALVVASTAHGAGGRYVLDGGTAAERHAVVAGLDASSFNWGVVPAVVKIYIVRVVDSFAVPGEIWLDADLLDAGTFAWGVVQHEYAHQVDYFLFDAELRARFLRLLGGDAWCYDGVPALTHLACCERFASTLAWSYWTSPENCMRPTAPGDESAAMEPRRFRAALRAALRQGESSARRR